MDDVGIGKPTGKQPSKERNEDQWTQKMIKKAKDRAKQRMYHKREPILQPRQKSDPLQLYLAVHRCSRPILKTS
jgi:hypothetical protein